MKKRYILFLLCLFTYVIYFKFMSFSHSIKDKNINLNLPDFIDKKFMKQNGFYLSFDNNIISWGKEDFFNFNLKNISFQDSIHVIFQTIPSMYPYVNRVLLYEVKPKTDEKIINLINSIPDSVQQENFQTNIDQIITEYYNFDSNYTIKRQIIDNKDSRRIIYYIVLKNKIPTILRFLVRLPYYLTFDSLIYSG